MATYVVSDLHGHYDVFEQGFEKIGFSSNDFLYVIGDAIDRGPEGIRILSEIKQSPNMELLIGNHEFMMLNSVDPDGEAICNGDDNNIWLFANGGNHTFEAYCTLSDEERQNLLAWLRSCYLIKTIDVNGEKICLTHSYYDKDCEHKHYSELSYRQVFNVVWTSVFRDDYYTHGADIYGDYDYLFVTGHVPVQKVMRWYEGETDYNGLDAYRKGNLIDIDGGLAMGKREGLHNGAIFLRLDDMKAFTLSL